MGLPNVGNRTQTRLGTDLVLNGSLHINQSPLGRDFYVLSAAQQAKLKGDLRTRSFQTMNEAWNACEANRGDKIYVAEGYTASIATADSWSNIKAGVRVIGMGRGSNRPKFTWTAAAATLLFDVANVTVENCQFELAGDPAGTTAITVAAAITVTGVGCGFYGNHFQIGVDADQIITLGILANAAKFEFIGNRVIGAAAAEITAAGTFLRLTAANEAIVTDNYIVGALATDTDGLIETLTTASINIDVSDNFVYSNGGSSTCAIDFGADLVNTGKLQRNLCVVDADGTAGSVVITQHANSNLALLDNFLVNNNGERGLVIGTASA